MDIKSSDISFEESAAIKGFLIIMIIIGHCYGLPYFPKGLFDYLYSFHVACFFILSFIYPSKHLTKERFNNYTVRLLLPYFMLYIIFSAIIFFFMLNGIDAKPSLAYGDYSFCGWLATLFTGGFLPLHIYTGMQYLWFMPAMFSFVIVRDLFKMNSAFIQHKSLFVFFCFICYFLVCVFSYYPPFPNKIVYLIQRFSPLSFFYSLGMIFVSYVTSIFLKNTRIKYYMGGFIAITLFFVFNLYTEFLKYESVVRCLRVLMPLLAFCFLYIIKGHLVRYKFLCAFGRMSMMIYIVQSPICVILSKMPYKFEALFNPIGSALMLIVIILTSYFVAKLLFVIPLTRVAFASRNLDQLKSFFNNN